MIAIGSFLATPNTSGKYRTSEKSMNRSIVSAMLVLSVIAMVCLVVGTARAQDPGCKPLYDAAVLQARTPSHIYSTMTGSSNLSTETVSTSDVLYVRASTTGSQWKKSSYSPQEEAKQAAESSRAYTSCQHVGDESINGEAAAIYTEVNKNSQINGKVWLSKTRGLPLKAELTMSSGHIAIRYDYSNVRPPAGAQ